MLARRGFSIQPLQESRLTPTVLSEEELMRDLRLLLPDGKQVVGADVYRYIMRRIWWAVPLYALGCAPGLRWLFDGAYRAFADHRFRISQSCGLAGAASRRTGR
jgi:predicted DCC family thiol-disulfide oxidoreductase YuxK